MFNEYLDQAWQNHASNTQVVADDLLRGIQLLESDAQVPQMAHLIAHVLGEHLGQWAKGIEILQSLETSPKVEAEGRKAIRRARAMLELAGDKRESLDEFSISDQVRILTMATSALAERQPETAYQFFRGALAISERLGPSDPANRSLAVTGNNLACALEEKSSRTPAEVELMIMAALTGRKYWELAGTWEHVQGAEYRLSQAYLVAGQSQLARSHAVKCLDIIGANDAKSFDKFSGYEALALAESALGNQTEFAEALKRAEALYLSLNEEEKKHTQNAIEKLRSKGAATGAPL